MNCYETIDLMGDALEGRLAPESRAGFDEHIDECSACRTYLHQLLETLLALKQLRASGTSNRMPELIAALQRESKKRG